MSAPPNTELVGNVAASVRTAGEVLGHLEASLRRGGFEEGLVAYRKMGEALANQRLWSSRDAPSQELDQLFAGLASRARTIYAILSPYVELMRQIGALDALVEATSFSAAVKNAKSDPILEILASGEMSLTALRSRIKAERGEMEARLDRLEKEGKVVSRTASGRRLYRLL